MEDGHLMSTPIKGGLSPARTIKSLHKSTKKYLRVMEIVHTLFHPMGHRNLCPFFAFRNKFI